jgi:hypothetical protein
MNGGNLDAVLEKLRELFQQEYQRGQQEALRRIVDVMKQPGARNLRLAGARGGKVRARRGSARAFIERVLNHSKGGATVPQILAAASSADEKSVSMSAIRFELYRGKKDRRYRNTKGKWSLPAKAGAKA